MSSMIMQKMLNAIDLRVNNLPGYNWIGDEFPVLSWKISGDPGTMQQYYRILASVLCLRCRETLSLITDLYFLSCSWV